LELDATGPLTVKPPQQWGPWTPPEHIVNTCTVDCHTALGNSKRHAHCVNEGCHRTFTGPSAFDKHQTGYDPVVCLDPTTVGLERKPSGLWGYPPPENPHWLSTRNTPESVTALENPL
jgi:hypothetical protein